ncbi:CDP-alcohol phosphatidyltransferase family protein [[Clostridium] symbiosum]|uniref:CDP-alcohol phosphatidyltransferase family protein n=1 Tax=Clostridium symbiosum TaxID=1512 RepID=UPI001D089D76|nr:CDP-alcohol phosphatidyltransferase family protein [[Clostridium] symbiosum]MCB6607717.1 CDP-alcohol phosphatidyltransferase family protein [[Clostridium] symbiosum]MCB6932578.1 CDP-alcohol phosphatidyltransferase family protein [[Clostridium] symbiosum]
MKYSARYFRESMPEWKRKKDPIFVRAFYRPVSFYGSAFCANLGIKANYVTVFSLFISFFAAISYFCSNHSINIIGASLINCWLVLDCIDGNLARSVERQPFGEFLDAMGSYILVSFLGIGIGVYVFKNGGLFLLSNNYWWIILGALISILDLLMRLTYQKYKNNSVELQESGAIPVELDKRLAHDSSTSIRTRIEMEFGIAGILPPAILVCTILNFLDIILVYMFLYNLTGCILVIILYTRKSLKYINKPIR